MDRGSDNTNGLYGLLQQIEAHLAALRADADAARRPWLTVKETAAVLQVSRDTIERMIAAGTLRAAKLTTAHGRGERIRYRIRRDWIDQCLAEDRTAARRFRRPKRRSRTATSYDFVD